ncbi:amino acid racemase [Bacillus manliponensis]|uniref:Amino acid racemase n=1 Tax=Bacillus manliponensis TaxID=574376 RepID=A0A073JW83_9BACI|nr:amino acid racemase [Bacillus manliponensis]KEK18486.1 amino acid racemase [Bacillus manliponensis]
MIGILAGMGPKSTAPFVDNVVQQCQNIYGAKDDMDFPHMMIYSCPTPFYMNRDIDHEEMKVAIIDGAKKLESTGVKFIAMPCNTAHMYFDDIQRALSVPLLNIVDATLKEVDDPVQKVAVFATNATINSYIYQIGLNKLGIQTIHKEEWQTSINTILTHIKAGDIQQGQRLWNELCNEVTSFVHTVIIACTDLNVVLKKQFETLRFIDSSACLAKAVVNQYLTEQKNTIR